MSPDWNAADVQAAKELFLADGPAARKGPAALLWQYWSATGPGVSLFDDPERDLALLLHARAYGVTDVGEGDLSPFGDLFRERRGEYAPLTPQAPVFGARTNLSLTMCAALDSPIMDVWVYEENSAPSLVLIFGTGLPQIRERIIADAFMTSVQLGTFDSDMVGTGIIRIESGSAARPPRRVPMRVVGRAGPLLPPPSTAGHVLQGFVARLRQLAGSTGLIRFHVADDAAHARVLAAIDDRINRAPGEPPMMWAPGAGDDRPEAAPVLMPVLTLPQGRTLELPLSMDLLSEPAYQALAQEYQGATLDRMVDDAQTRYAYHAAETKRLRDDHEAYKATPVRDRVAMWGAKVTVSYFFDFDAHRAIRLPFPEDIDAEPFYLIHVPKQAERHEQAATSMQQILDDVRAATASPEAPIPSLIAGSLLDAAMRGRRPVGTQAFAMAFDAWADRVRPMLCFEWRRALRAQGIDPGHVFTSHGVVRTYFAQDGETLLQVPFTVMDQQHSAALFDLDHRVVVIRDPSDCAAEAPAVSPPEADEGWAGFVSLAERRDVALTDFEAEFMARMRAAPVETITRSLEILSGQGMDQLAAATAEVANIEGMVGAAQAELAVSYGMRHAWTALGVAAFHTVHTQLAALRDSPGRLGAQVALTEAVAVYLISFAGDKDAAYRCFSRPEASGLQPRFEAAVRRAKQRDRAYTEEWIGLLDPRKKLDFGRVMGRLQLDLPGPETLPDRQQRAVLLARTGAEAARLARQLEHAAEELSDSGESFAAAFAKLGLALEDVLLADFAGGSRIGAIGLLQILTGQATTADDEG